MPEMTLRRRSAGLVAGLALALVASACASGSSETAAPASPGERISSPPPSSQGPAIDGPDGGGTDDPAEPGIVPEILDFEAPLVGGGTLNGAELAGAPVALWFWAPW